MAAMSPRAPSCLIVVSLTLLACDAPTGSRTEAVVYGEDDRMEPYAHPSAVHRAVARSAIAVEIRASNLDESDPSNVRIDYTRTLSEAKMLCPGEPFEDQIEPGECSGTLLDDEHVITAGHCVDEVEDCDGTMAWVLGFRYESPGVLAPLTSNDVYRCRRVLAYIDDGVVDHAVIQLDRPVVGHTPVTVRPAPGGLPVGTPLTLIGHPNGLPMKIASNGEITTTDGSGLSLTATLDAFSGNSGSGVFNDAGELVAILTAGMDDYVPSGSCNVVNTIDPPPTDDGEELTYVGAALDEFCLVPGVDSPVCDCMGPCIPAEPGDTCGSAERIEGVSQSIAATMVGFNPTRESPTCGGVGPDRIWVFDLEAPSRVRAESSGYDTILYLTEGCDGAEITCNDDIDTDTNRGSLIDVEVPAGSYALYLDSYDFDVGDFTVNIEITELASTGPDGGPSPDGSVGSDGSTSPDAGSRPDAATPMGRDGGCSAAASDAHGSTAFVLAVVFLIFRRRRDG
jgi:MYXO-CTERM domain-containing protein